MSTLSRSVTECIRAQPESAANIPGRPPNQSSVIRGGAGAFIAAVTAGIAALQCFSVDNDEKTYNQLHPYSALAPELVTLAGGAALGCLGTAIVMQEPDENALIPAAALCTFGLRRDQVFKTRPSAFAVIVGLVIVGLLVAVTIDALVIWGPAFGPPSTREGGCLHHPRESGAGVHCYKTPTRRFRRSQQTRLSRTKS